MFLLYDTRGYKEKFETIDELSEYIKMRHAEEGGFDWFRKSEMTKENTMDVVGV